MERIVRCGIRSVIRSVTGVLGRMERIVIYGLVGMERVVRCDLLVV